MAPSILISIDFPIFILFLHLELSIVIPLWGQWNILVEWFLRHCKITIWSETQFWKLTNREFLLEIPYRRRLTLKNHVFLNFKMHFREPVILETQILSLIRTFIHGYCEDLTMKLNLRLGIPSKYKDPWSLRHCFCCCMYIFRKINWHIIFSLWFITFLQSTDTKNVLMKHSLFWENWHAISFFRFVPFSCYVLVGIYLKHKAVHCILRF